NRLTGLQALAEPLPQHGDGRVDVVAIFSGCGRPCHAHASCSLPSVCPASLPRERRAPLETMFTQSCSNVKAPLIVLARISLDFPDAGDRQKGAGVKKIRLRQENKTMIKKILSFGRHLAAGNENWDGLSAARRGAVSPENARALATGAALAVSLDASPAVLVSIY